MTALLLSVLLVFAPVQSSPDSALSAKVEQLENRVEELETKQEVRQGYYLDTLSGERTIYASILGIFSVLFAALLSFVGFLSFRHYISRVENTREEMESTVTSQLSGIEDRLGNLADNVQENEEYVGSIVKRVNRLEVKQDSELGFVDHVADFYPAKYLKTLSSYEEVSEKVKEENIEGMEYEANMGGIKSIADDLELIAEEYDGIPLVIKENAIDILENIRSNVKDKYVEHLDRAIEVVKNN